MSEERPLTDEGEFLTLFKKHQAPLCAKREERLRKSESRLDRLDGMGRMLFFIASGVLINLIGLAALILQAMH